MRVVSLLLFKKKTKKNQFPDSLLLSLHTLFEKDGASTLQGARYVFVRGEVGLGGGARTTDTAARTSVRSAGKYDWPRAHVFFRLLTFIF